MFNKQFVDLFLIQRAVPARLARADPDRLWRSQIEQSRAGQVVVDDHIGRRQHVGPTAGQQPRIAGSGSHQINHPHAPALGFHVQQAPIVVSTLSSQDRQSPSCDPVLIARFQIAPERFRITSTGNDFLV